MRPKDDQFETTIFEESITPFAAITVGDGITVIGTLGDPDRVIAAS